MMSIDEDELGVRFVAVRRAVHSRDKARDAVSIAMSNSGTKRYFLLPEGTSLHQGI